jgi:hypothetical protein
MFVNYDGIIAKPNGAPNPNDFHLHAGSPAVGSGNATCNSDIGAYTSDATKSNQR